MSIIRSIKGRPGAACKKLFGRMGIAPAGRRCRCNQLADDMDEQGVEYVKENLNHYVVELRRSSAEWIEENRPKLKKFGVPIKLLMKQIILKCVREAEGKTDFRDTVLDSFLDTFFPYQEGYEERPVELPTDLSEKSRFLAENPFHWSEEDARQRNRQSITVRLVR